MCGEKIIERKCSCGEWKTSEELGVCVFREALEAFDQMKKFTITGDAPHVGAAFVFFRGDHMDCRKVQEFIYEMKGRKYYEE